MLLDRSIRRRGGSAIEGPAQERCGDLFARAQLGVWFVARDLRRRGGRIPAHL